MDKVVGGSHFRERIINISTLLKDIQTKKAKKRKIEEIIILLYFDLIKRFEEKRPKNEISHNINMH